MKYLITILCLIMIGCGGEITTSDSNAIDTPAPAPSPIPPVLNGVFRGLNNNSEVILYADSRMVYVQSMYLEFYNNYVGLPYFAYITLSGGFYGDIYQNKVRKPLVAYKVSSMTVTTEAPDDILSDDSNYGALSFHQATVDLIPTSGGLTVRLQFIGTSKYRDGHIYLDRTFDLTKVD